MSGRSCNCQQRDQRYKVKRERGEELKNDGNTHSPVGCSYLPVTGVSKVTETDMLGKSQWFFRKMNYKCVKVNCITRVMLMQMVF